MEKSAVTAEASGVKKVNKVKQEMEHQLQG